jgi:L-serine dehydratase
VIVGSSLGAGRVRLSEIDGYPVEITGSYHTMVLAAEDRRGSIARIAQLLADGAINIATLRLSRRERGGDAFMVVEADDSMPELVCDSVRALPWVRWVRALDKVSA